ncbi:unnamed protein product [Cuscuta campestris]|uniref:Uncharacterized protein n=1 Tax=Cuscuta campestris TaxID=132261 RepID=A0A484M6K0_9ASTE|nr:unnamed protein product [Cuscuta campestris]
MSWRRGRQRKKLTPNTTPSGVSSEKAQETGKRKEGKVPGKEISSSQPNLEAMKDPTQDTPEGSTPPTYAEIAAGNANIETSLQLIPTIEQWKPGLKINTEDLTDIPIWVQFTNLDVKYWSLSGLSKLGSLIGKLIKRDKATTKISKFAYARILVEVKVHQNFPQEIAFLDEAGIAVSQRVEYEWKLDDLKDFCVTFVYGQNEAAKRCALWNDIENIAASCDLPWCIIGDFNSVLDMNDRIGGSPVSWDETRDFKQCIQKCGLEEIPSEDSRYTWSNRQGLGKRIYSKIDRTLANVEWFLMFDTKLSIQEEGLSDHTPLILKDCTVRRGNYSFKFCDMWMLDPQFSEIVESIWNLKVVGRYSYQLISKLKSLKPLLRGLNKNKFSQIHQQCNLLREQLFQVQEEIKKNLRKEKLIIKELEITKDLNWKLKAARLMKSQRVKPEWIHEGDANSKLFFAWVKKRRLMNHISFIKNSRGQMVEGKNEIAKVLIDHFQNLLGKTDSTEDINENIIAEGKVLFIEQQLQLIAPVTIEEIKKQMFDIPNSKSPGPDGFSSGFFKQQWKVVCDLVSKTVLEFFKNGHTLQQINHTNLCLIPKVNSPEKSSDFRPIACYNVIYKVSGGPRIGEKECDLLVEKLTTKISSWVTKHLSYAGRVRLINSVLYGVVFFCSRIFLLPNKVMKKIMALCRNFLWSSTPDYKKCPLISWDDVCLPKQEGGLGLKNLLLWNQACTMKLMWDVAKKKDSLWVKWVHGRYLKHCTI